MIFSNTFYGFSCYLVCNQRNFEEKLIYYNLQYKVIEIGKFCIKNWTKREQLSNETQFLRFGYSNKQILVSQSRTAEATKLVLVHIKNYFISLVQIVTLS